jgi:hypothetical protein
VTVVLLHFPHGLHQQNRQYQVAYQVVLVRHMVFALQCRRKKVSNQHHDENLIHPGPAF